jgi:hypothetical protein
MLKLILYHGCCCILFTLFVKLSYTKNISCVRRSLCNNIARNAKTRRRVVIVQGHGQCSCLSRTYLINIGNLSSLAFTLPRAYVMCVVFLEYSTYTTHYTAVRNFSKYRIICIYIYTERYIRHKATLLSLWWELMGM